MAAIFQPNIPTDSKDYDQIKNQILTNIISEKEVDLAIITVEQLNAEILHRYQLRMLFNAVTEINDFKQYIQSKGMLEDDKNIILAIADYIPKQTARFSLSSKY